MNQSRKLAVLASLTLASLTAAPRLSLSTVAVGPVFVSPGANGSTQTVEAFNSGDGALALTAAGSATWLAPSVGSPRACTTRSGTCTPINIALNTAALAAGTYTEFVTLSDPNAVDAPTDISVTITVAGIPNAITLYATPFGGTQPTVASNVFASSAVTGTPTTQTGGRWLSFSSGSAASINFLLPYTVQAAAQIGQAPGAYTGAVAIAGSRTATENKTVAVTLNITCSPIISVNNSTIRLSGTQGGSIQYSVVSFQNLAQGTGAAAGCATTPLAVTAANATSSSGNFLTASLAGSSGLLIAADPSSLAPGNYSGTVTITSNAANNALVSIPVQLTVEPSGRPQISAGGMINIANYAQEAVSPGDIVAIFGSQLAGAVASNTGPPPLATQLGQTQVLVNGVPAPLYFVAPSQVNFQMPYSASGSAVVQVTNNGVAGNSRSVAITAIAPRFLIWDSLRSSGYAIAVNNTDGSLPLPSGNAVPGFPNHPAKPGDAIVLYGIGFGQTTPAAVDGAPASAAAATLQRAAGTTTVTFGGGFNGRPVIATADFAGLTPTAVGLYQVNVTIPLDAPLGALVPVTANVNGSFSTPTYIAISATGR